MAKRPAPTLREIAILHNGIMPALNKSKGLPLWRKKLKKKYPPIKPNTAIDKNISAPKFSKKEARASLSFFKATSLPKAIIRWIKERAMIIPPANPPPGLRCPCKTI